MNKLFGKPDYFDQNSWFKAENAEFPKDNFFLLDISKLKSQLINELKKILSDKWSISIEELKIEKTSEKFDGDLSIALFSIAKLCKVSVKEISEIIITELITNPLFKKIEHTNGFLNFSFASHAIIDGVKKVEELLSSSPNKRKGNYLIEYSSPNTNKPLHLGHLRNNFLGQSLTNILDYLGYNVNAVCIVNDRGIHICKSMAAYILFGDNASPETLNMKGDKFVGHFYVLFDMEYKKQISALVEKGLDEESAKKDAPIMKFAYALLIKWENGDTTTMELWEKMNSWVYEGFKHTYELIGTRFDKVYYESNTYSLGKNIVNEGLEKEIFYKKSDNSVWIDLQDCGLDSKLVLRGDQTSVYITQDLGTFKQRYNEYNFDKCIYVVGNEQDYHFKVLAEIIAKFDKKFEDSLYHLSYGMVELPHGKMKSREGTVVDADDLIEETKNLVRANCQSLDKKFESCEDLDMLYESIALAAIKFHFIKVDNTKKIVYNPAEALDFQGQTGVFIQYAHARIQSLIEKSEVKVQVGGYFDSLDLNIYERDLAFALFEFFAAIDNSGSMLSPNILANHLYELAKNYNKFYAAVPILSEENVSLKNFRLYLSDIAAKSIKLGLKLIGIAAPNRM